MFSLVVLIGTGVLYKLVPTGFIPTQDTGQIIATTEAAQGTSFADMVKHQQQVAAIVAQRHEYRRLHVFGWRGRRQREPGTHLPRTQARTASV